MTGPVGQSEARVHRRPAGRRGSAFTLVDVLVTMAVVALLIGIMLPGLGRVSELSKQVVCRSNLRQVGFGLAMYSDAHRDQLPSSVYLRVSTARGDQVPSRPQQMMTLRLGQTEQRTWGETWDGLGWLYSTETLPSQEIFYCPSHHGDHPFERYEPMWRRQGNKEIVGNYHFRGEGPNGRTTRLSFIEPSRSAIAADGMRTIADYNHRVGLNVLRADLSLFWMPDANGAIADYLTYEGREWNYAEFDLLWDQLDNPDDPVLPRR